MEPPINHQCFEAAAAAILSMAYEAFPATITISNKEHFEQVLKGRPELEHCASINRDGNELMRTTSKFLKREGVIHFEDENVFEVERITLTSKGFLLLNSPMDLTRTTQAGPTLGQRLGEVSKSSASLAIKTVITELIKRSLGSTPS